jgi:YHS domain-containing protein
MQLAGNPSLIDPTRAEPLPDEGLSDTMLAALSKLSKTDQKLAKNQRVCPVTMMSLGSMGAPPKVDVNGEAVFICCEGCRNSLLEQPQKYLELIKTANTSKNKFDSENDTELPPLGMPESMESDDSLPPIGMPLEIEPQPFDLKPPKPVIPQTAAGQKKEAR